MNVEKLVLTVLYGDAIFSLGVGVGLKTLEELLKIEDPPDDLSTAGGAVVRVQLGPAVTTDEVSPGALEDLGLAGVLDIADLREDNHGIAEEK